MQNRAQQHHRERLTGAIREEVSTLITGELRDPRIGLVTLTDVVMQAGGKAYRIYVSVEGTEKDAEESIEGLRAAVGFIRHALAENLELRKAPDLSFHLDMSEKHADRIGTLLERVNKRKKSE